MEAVGGDGGLHEVGEAGFVDGGFARLHEFDFFFVDVDADDVVAGVGEANAGDEADVAGADDADFHSNNSFNYGWNLHPTTKI